MLWQTYRGKTLFSSIGTYLSIFSLPSLVACIWRLVLRSSLLLNLTSNAFSIWGRIFPIDQISLRNSSFFLFGPSIFSATSFPFAVRINDSSAPFPVLITIFLRSRIVISFQAEKGPVSFMDLLLYFEAASFNSSFRKLGGLSSLNAFTIAKAPDPGCNLNPSPDQTRASCYKRF